MNTWTSKPALALLALGILSGCGTGPAAGLLGGLTDAVAPKSVALSEARMAAGDLLLVPPQGYCIDKRSVSAGFAIMARCDILQPDLPGRGMPVGVITVSLSPDAQAMPTPEQTATALGLTDLSDPTTTDNATVFRASGPAPFEGMAPTQWRGTALIGGLLMGAAFYRPDGSAGPSDAGKSLLLDLIDRTLTANS